jgi:hypothetical protein
MTGKPPAAVASSRLTEGESKVGSNATSHPAIAIPTALVDHGKATATATAAQSASLASVWRSGRVKRDDPTICQP